MGRAELGQAGACAGNAGRPSGGGELGPGKEWWAAGLLRRWAGADWAGLGRKEVGRGFGLLGWFFWVPFLFYFFSFPLNSKLFEFK